MRANRHPSFQLSFVSGEEETPVPEVSEVLGRVRSAAPWDEVSISPGEDDFPRVHISWHGSAGFSFHCFEDDRSLGRFLVNARDFSLPSVEINLGGQALELWPCELFVSGALASAALEYFLDHAGLNPSLSWTGTVDFPRQTIWEGHEEREAWERTHRTP